MIKPFITLDAVAAPLPINNIDTDQIIPSREIKTVGKTGLGEGLFAGWRYLKPGERTPSPGFVLNQPVYKDANIIVAGANFGCGSSREHAVWALAEYGIRAIIAPSFGEIFFGNCARNGVLAVALNANEVDFLTNWIASDPLTNRVFIDLNAQIVRAGDKEFVFNVNPYHKQLLLEGADPIALTLRESDSIDSFLERDRVQRPWLYETERER